MGIIVALIVGLLVGGIAKVLIPSRAPGGLQTTVLLGMGGALFAFLIGRIVGWYGAASAGPGVIASVLGALFVLAGYRWVREPA
jgi:uncharacterized membrane protein YeaQ/YmgE (transglycosylase-associated protein family)